MKGWVICRLIWISSNNTTKRLLRHWVQWNHRYCIVENCILSLGTSERDLSAEEFSLRFASIKSHTYSDDGEYCLVILCQSVMNSETAEVMFQFQSSEHSLPWKEKIENEIIEARKEQQLLTTKAVQAVNNFIKERVILQSRQYSREPITELVQNSLPNEPIITKSDDYQVRFQAEVVDVLGPAEEPSEWSTLLKHSEEELISQIGDQRSEEDFVLVDQPNDTESMDSPRNSSHKPSFTTLTAMFGFNNSTPPPPTPLSVASSDWNLPINETKRKSGFTGHSRVLLSAGGHSNQESVASGNSSLTNQYLSRNPWNWSCPIPRLRILLMAVGTRGDVQPFALLGMKLLQDGHRVRLATHECYRQYVLSFGGGGLEFFPLAGDPVKLSEFMVKTHGNIIPTSSEVIKQVPENLKMLNDIINSTWSACVEIDPLASVQRPFIADAIISNPVTYGHIHCAEALGVPLHLMFPQPWVPTKAFPHPLACLSYSSNENKWSTENYLSYQLVERMMWISLEPFINTFRKNRLGLSPIRRGEHGWNLLNTNKVPFSKMWSKYLVPKPKDWEPHVEVVGFFLDKSDIPKPVPGSAINPWNQKPIDDKLPDIVKLFLVNGPPPIFVGFGSMVVESPMALVQVFIEAAAALGTRIIFQSGWTEMNPEFFASLCSDVERRARIKGLQGVKALKDIYERYVAPENRPTSTKSSSYLTRLWVASDALLIGACSHDSLFPHVAAVVHHGGAGTTAAGIRAARPTLICPFFGDQPFWGEMVFRAKVGPEPCPIQQVSLDRIARKFFTLLLPEISLNAKLMSERFESEDGVDNALSAFYRHLHIENMICDISIFLGESQLAHVWCQRCGFKMTREVSECVHNPANGLISVNDLSQHHVVPCIYVNWSQNRGPNNASEGMIQGLGGAAHELVAGLTDTVLEPVNALFKGDGITGAVTGVVHGLRGFMISPLSGGKILLSKVTEGLKNSLTNPSLPDPNNQFSRDGSYQRPDGSVYLETRTIQEETSVPLSSVSHSPVNVHPKGFSTLDHSIPLEMSCFFSPNLFENEVSPDVVELDHVLQQTLKESVLESDIPASSDSFSSNESQTDFPQINFEAAMLEESNQQNELQPPSDDEFCSDEDQAENSLMLESQVDMSAILGSMALEDPLSPLRSYEEKSKSPILSQDRSPSPLTTFYQRNSERRCGKRDALLARSCGNLDWLHGDGNDDLPHQDSDNASPLREMKLLEIDDSDLESHHSSEEDSPNLNYHETEIPTNNPSLLERKEEIIRAYQRATHIKDSLLDLLGSSSRFITLEDFASFILHTLSDSPSCNSEKSIQDIVHTLLQNLSGTKTYFDFIDISLIYLTAEPNGNERNHHWKQIPTRIIR